MTHSSFKPSWTENVEIRNAVYRAVCALNGGKPDTYDVDFVLGAIADAGLRIVADWEDD